MGRLQPGQSPPHLVIRRDAMVLTAKLRPVGSVNIVAVGKMRGLADKALLAADARGRSLLAESGHPSSFLSEYLEDSEVIATLKNSGHVPHVVHLMEAMNILRYVKVSGVDETPIRYGTGVPRLMTHTDDGAMLLPPDTILVWV